MQNQKSIPISRMIILLFVLINVIVIRQAYTGSGKWYYVLILTLPLLILAITNTRQRKHYSLRNFPVKKNTISFIAKLKHHEKNK